jgi:hypothetical protein
MHLLKNILLIILILSSITLYSQEDGIKNNSENLKKVDTDLLNKKNASKLFTAFFDLESEKVKEKDLIIINESIAEALKSYSFIDYIPDEYLLDNNNKKTKCNNLTKALQFGKILTADRVIIGNISKKVKKTTESMGNEGINKYLVKVKTRTSYILEFQIIDAYTNKLLTTFKLKIKSKKLKKKDIRKFEIKLVEFFQINKIFKNEKKIALIENKKEEIIEDNGTISLLYTQLTPQADYADIIESGKGIALNIGIRNAFFSNFYIQIDGGYNQLINTIEYIDSYNMGHLSLLFGYELEFLKYFSITPLMGAGYLGNIIKYNKEYLINGVAGEDTILYDPFVTGRIDISLKPFSWLNLVFTPGINYFFQQEAQGYFVTMSGGIRFVF